MILLLALGLLAQTPLFADDAKPYVTRGDTVETHYKDYTAKLLHAFESLKSAARNYAPDLEKKILGDPPAPVRMGWGIVPKIIPEALTQKPEAPKGSVTYSWPKTDQFISNEQPMIDDIEEKTRFLAKLSANERHNVLSKMIDDYAILADNQHLIDHHIKYNRFWQDTIAADRARFDHLTMLHDEVLELSRLKDRAKSMGSNPVIEARSTEIEADIRRETLGQCHDSKFVKWKHPKPWIWILEVPIYTDITDRAFLKQFKAAIERVWKWEEPPPADLKTKVPQAPSFSVNVVWKPMQPYRKKPAIGEHIDLAVHTRLFPENGAVLTTGAEATYALPNRFIALGPQDMNERSLAHEFGHLLGFIDGYFRGYHDIGENGFEVLEIVPDASDIMNNPTSGRVFKSHFERLLELRQ